MAIPGYPHAVAEKKKRGKTRVYFQGADGPKVPMSYEPGSPDFDKLYQALLNTHTMFREPRSKKRGAVRERSEVLPYNLPPRGVSRETAAAYIGISPSLLDDMVEQGKLPRPIQFGHRNVWDRWKIDEALTRLSVELGIPI